MSAPGLHGHLRLVCRADPAGRSYLAEQSFCAPFHLSKPYWDGAVLTVQVVNPTAGLFDGDAAELRVRVEPGARLRLVSPSAMRVHRAREAGREAVLTQHFAVARGGWLEVRPELLIPQAGSRLRQVTRIEVEPGGELYHLEMLTPGRVASGEVFAFCSIRSDTNIFVGPQLVARERLRLSAEEWPGSLEPLTRIFPAPGYAAILAITDAAADDRGLLESVHQLQSGEVWVGGSRLVAGGWMVRIVARDNVQLRRAVEQTRAALFDAFGWRREVRGENNSPRRL